MNIPLVLLMMTVLMTGVQSQADLKSILFKVLGLDPMPVVVAPQPEKHSPCDEKPRVNPVTTSNPCEQTTTNPCEGPRTTKDPCERTTVDPCRTTVDPCRTTVDPCHTPDPCNTPKPVADPCPKNCTWWSYSNPEEWAKRCSKCGGCRQSPIMIKPCSATLQNYARLQFVNYDLTLPLLITNNWKTVIMRHTSNVPDNKRPSISGGGLKDTFVFSQVHFRWGKTMINGSEHGVDGQRYSGEMQMIHVNSKYCSYDDALTHDDGLVILATFIEPQTRGNIAFRHFTDLIGRIRNEGQEVVLPVPFPLMDLLPDNTDNFYQYQGSLTFPGCEEVVTWIVFDTPAAASESQMKQFRLLFDRNGNPIEFNNRPIVSNSDKRTVYYRSENGKPLRRPG